MLAARTKRTFYTSAMYHFQSKLSLPKEVHEIFWRVISSNKEIRDLYLHRNHSIHSRIWDPNFHDDAQQTTAWLTSIEMCEQVALLLSPFFDFLHQVHHCR